MPLTTKAFSEFPFTSQIDFVHTEEIQDHYYPPLVVSNQKDYFDAVEIMSCIASSEMIEHNFQKNKNFFHKVNGSVHKSAVGRTTLVPIAELENYNF